MSINPTQPQSNVSQEETSLQRLEHALIDERMNPTVPPPEDASDPKRKKTAGEIAFDRIVYTGIGFGVNEGAALVLGDQFEHGIGKNAFRRISDWMVKNMKFTQSISKEGKIITAHQKAGNALITFALLLDGTLLVWPMKKLEDAKAYWVRAANHYFDKRGGNKLTPEEVAARDAEVDAAIACEPRQSWPSLLVGRGAAIVTTMSNSMFIMGPERMQKAANLSENLLTRGRFSVAPTAPEGAPKTMGQRMAFLAGIETVCCALAAGVLEVTSKLFARSRSKPLVHNAELCDTATTQAAASDSVDTDTKTAAAEKQLRIDKKDPAHYKTQKPVATENYAALASQINSPSSPGL